MFSSQLDFWCATFLNSKQKKHLNQSIRFKIKDKTEFINYSDLASVKTFAVDGLKNQAVKSQSWQKWAYFVSHSQGKLVAYLAFFV
jgi:hypothetical protein